MRKQFPIYVSKRTVHMHDGPVVMSVASFDPIKALDYHPASTMPRVTVAESNSPVGFIEAPEESYLLHASQAKRYLFIPSYSWGGTKSMVPVAAMIAYDRAKATRDGLRFEPYPQVHPRPQTPATTSEPALETAHHG